MNINGTTHPIVFFALAGALVCANAASIMGSDSASVWSRATQSERSDYASSVTRICSSSNCNTASIKACLDVALTPAPKLNMTIAEAAAACVVLMKSEN